MKTCANLMLGTIGRTSMLDVLSRARLQFNGIHVSFNKSHLARCIEMSNIQRLNLERRLPE